MTDQNRKTLRSFYCRDYLWEHFEQMAQELGCSMDYLINESMRLYARNRDHRGNQEQQEPVYDQQPVFSGAAPAHGAADHFGGAGGFDRGMNHRTFERVPAVGGGQVRAQQPSMPHQSARPSPPGFSQRSPGGPPPPPPRPGSAGWQNLPERPQPPGANFGSEPVFGGPQTGGRAPLYLSFNNNRYVIDQDKYVIGRGSEKTDLTIRDGNISRRHCAVIFRNGAYYIKDMGSTNGIEYRGNRIESKKIEEGDVFFLCDYELRFSYRA